MERLNIYCLTYEEDAELHSIFHVSKTYLQSLKETWSASGAETYNDKIFSVNIKTKTDLVNILEEVRQTGFLDR